MAKFNWDDHPVVSQGSDGPAAEAPAFKWDDHPVVEAPSSYSQLQSALMGGINQFNAAPVVGAALLSPHATKAKLTNALMGMIGGPQLPEADTKIYDTNVGAIQKEFKQAESDNPLSYLGGNVGVGVALTPFLPGSGLAKATTGLRAVGQGAKVGAELGAMTGLGSALSEGKDVGGVAASTGLGAAGGGVLGGVAGGIAHKLAPSNLEKAAAENTAEAFSPSKPQTKNLFGAPLSQDVVDDVGNVVYNAPKGKTYFEQVGNTMSTPTEFLGGKAPAELLGSPGERLDNLNTMIDKSGKVIGEAIDSFDTRGDKFNGVGKVRNFITDLQRQYGMKADPSISKPGYEGVYQDLSNALGLIDDQLGTGNASSFGEASKVLGDIGGLAYQKDSTSAKSEVLSSIRGYFNKLLEEDMNRAAQNLGDPSTFKRFMDAKEVYRASKALMASAEGANAAEISNRDFGLFSHLGGWAGAHVAGPIGAVTAVTADKLAKFGTLNLGAAAMERGLAKGMNQVVDKAQKMTQVMGKTISAATPEQMVNWGQQLATQADPIKQQLGRVFSEAASKDQVGRNALMFTLMQNPTYRETLSGLAGGKD